MRLEGSRARARAAGSRITHMANQPTCVDGRITSFSDAAHANAAARRGCAANVRERALSRAITPQHNEHAAETPAMRDCKPAPPNVSNLVIELQSIM